MPENSAIPELIPAEEAARLLHRTTTTLRNWRWKGIGPSYVKFGGRAYYRPEALAEFITGHETRPEGGPGPA